jgi:hypothetical protein
MADIFDVEGDSVDNPIHENTGSDPEGVDGRTLVTTSPVEQKAAELLALIDDVPFWRNHDGEKRFVFGNMLKGDSGLAELVDDWFKSPHWQNNVGADWKSFRLSLESASPEFKAELKEQLLGAGRLKTHVHALYETLTSTTVEEVLKAMAKLGSWPGELTRTLTDEDADRIRSELLALMAPFPPTLAELGTNTLTTLDLLKGLPDSEVRKVTNKAFIEAITKALPPQPAAGEGANTQPVAKDYFANCSGELAAVAKEALPEPDEVVWNDSEALIKNSGAAFNCAATPWEQWIRFPDPDSAAEYAFLSVDYFFIDPIDDKTSKRDMDSRVALLSVLVRAMGTQCPPDMKFASLQGANFAGAILTTRNSFVDLSGSWMVGSVLAGGFLWGARLRGTCLGGSSLQKCDLSESDLTNSFVQADRRGASLSNTTLKNCVLDDWGWDPGPALPRQHTRSPKPLGILKMVWRAVMASGADGDEDDDDEEGDDEDGDDYDDGDDGEGDEGDGVADKGDDEDDKDNWEVKDEPDALLLEFAKSVPIADRFAETLTAETLLQQLADQEGRKPILDKLEKDIAELVKLKQQIEKSSRKLATKQVAAKVGPMIDVKTLRGQYKTFRNAASKDGGKKKELLVFLRLKKEMITAAERIDARLKSAKERKDFEKWAMSAAETHKAWLRSAAAPLKDTRIATLVTASLESSSSYNFGFFTDFTAMMSTDARQLAGDKKELEILATEMDELLVPISVLNWEDVLNSWITLIELCGKFHGTRSQAILRQLFDDEKLLGAIGMANQCRGIKTGENGADMPEILLKLFKDGTAATLRRDKFTYQQAINREQANIDRVTKRQGQFVAFLGSIVLGIIMCISQLVSIWLAARLGLEDVSYDDGSL